MPLAHRGLETVLCNSDPLTQDRGLEGQRCKVTLHLLNIVLVEKLQVLNIILDLCGGFGQQSYGLYKVSEKTLIVKSNYKNHRIASGIHFPFFRQG